MNNNNFEKIVNNSFPQEISSRIISDYVSLQKKMLVKDWKGTQLEISHIVEHIRRFLENVLLQTPINYSKKLQIFSELTLKQYESAAGDESLRINIPRILYSMSSIRNKRSVGHTNEVIANKMDALYMLNSLKWCLGEIIRLNSNLSVNEINEIIESLLLRGHEIIWTNGLIPRILNPNLSAPNQTLILLFFKEKMIDEELRNSIEYKNSTDFKNKVLKKLHKDRLIEYSKNGECEILPPGIEKVEKILYE
jgi:hypothetical protein